MSTPADRPTGHLPSVVDEATDNPTYCCTAHWPFEDRQAGPANFWSQLQERCNDGVRIFATTGPTSPTHWLLDSVERERRSLAALIHEALDNFEPGDGPSYTYVDENGIIDGYRDDLVPFLARYLATHGVSA